jgi:hypothetical protein
MERTLLGKQKAEIGCTGIFFYCDHFHDKNNVCLLLSRDQLKISPRAFKLKCQQLLIGFNDKCTNK